VRTFLLVAPDEAAIEAGLAAAQEVLVVDLADTEGGGRPPPAGGGGKVRIFARVSSLRSGAIDDELAQAVRLGAEGIMLSGAVGLPDCEQLGARLAVLEAEHGRHDGVVQTIPLIDTAEGVLSLPTMRPRPRLDAIAINPAALAESLGCARRAPAIAQAIGMTVLAAGACRVGAAIAVRGEHARELAEAHEAGFEAVLLRRAQDVSRARALRPASAASSRTSSRASPRNTRDSRPA
jgi:citrate lyase subunit beta/citryl-CoA lyase